MNPKTRKFQSGRVQWTFIAGAAVVAILLAVLAAVVMQDDDAAQLGPLTGEMRAAALARDYAPTTGNPDAPVHIVEFLDPACETCAIFYPLVKPWLEEAPDKLRLTIRHIPFHRGAEYAVQILEASREQDLYWETLETLLATQDQWTQHHTVMPERIAPAIASVGLDMEQLKSDMNSADIQQRIEQDRNDAMALQVRATPQYFVNGRELTDFGYEQLAALVQEELMKAGE